MILTRQWLSIPSRVVYFVMIIDTCHSSLLLDIDDTTTSFRNLKLSNFLLRICLIWPQLLLIISKPQIQVMQWMLELAKIWSRRLPTPLLLTLTEIYSIIWINPRSWRLSMYWEVLDFCSTTLTIPHMIILDCVV